MQAKLMVGMYRKDITPPGVVNLRGQFYTRISEYVESTLYANVFAAQSGNEQLIICACDLSSIDAGVVAQIRSLIHSRCADIDVSKIIFSATHTHTGPWYYKITGSLHIAANFLPEGKRFVDEEPIPAGVWTDVMCGGFIAERLCEAVCEAWAARRPSFLAPGFGRAVTGHCRRVVYDDATAKMYGSADTPNFEALEGGNDSGVELLYIFDAEQKPMGVLVNIACPSQCVEHARYISSDFWGKARDFVRESFGDSFVVVGLCAAAGDQSPRDLIRRPGKKKRRTDANMFDLEGAMELGRRIADVVTGQYGEAKQSIADTPVLRHEVLTIDFPLRRVTITEYEDAKRHFDDYVARSGKDEFTSGDLSQLHIYGGIMERFQVQAHTYFYSSEIHVARLGDMAFATNPFELFLDYGNQIRARSCAEQTMLVQLACDSGGYLPTEKAERGSHYSAYVSSGKTGHAGGALLVEKTLSVLDKLWSDQA